MMADDFQQPEPGFRFRSLTRADYRLLVDWFVAPHVSPWWQESAELDDIETRYGPVMDRTDATEVFIVERDTIPIGLVQRYRLVDNSDWQGTLRSTGAPLNGFGIDYLIGVAHLVGKGLGTEIIAQFVTDSWRCYPECPACVVGVSQENRRSWRALERAGFLRVWSGLLASNDPSDSGPQYMYVKERQA
jgi:aminoglycoside 6'-N-acetyltransferase